MNPEKFEAVAAALAAEEPEHPFLATVAEMRERMKDRPRYETVRIPAGDFFDVRDRALRAHASQVAPDHPFFFWPNDVQRRAWPYEDFQLVQSRVAVPDAETDLFDGVDDTE